MAVESPSVSGYLDRYPAKMVARLANGLIARHVSGRAKVLDPLCGSGAILCAAKHHGYEVVGWDLNPYATLLSTVKLNGFSSNGAEKVSAKFLTRARSGRRSLPIRHAESGYWFTTRTLTKLEALRESAKHYELAHTREGRAVLLALALSVRRCSRADQRSPKPFISHSARTNRTHRHFDPLVELPRLLASLSHLYGREWKPYSRVSLIDVKRPQRRTEIFTHVLTSPPYINAQDYFRNFKLELFVLEDLLSFDIGALKYECIGRERGNLIRDMSLADIEAHRRLCPAISIIERRQPKEAEVVHRYLLDMSSAFDTIRQSLSRNGLLVLVCGDNLIARTRIPTWQLMRTLLRSKGFSPVDKYGDCIERRYVPPRRKGHKGLIKQEVVIAYRKEA